MKPVEETELERDVAAPLSEAPHRGIALFALDRGEQHYPGSLIRSEPGLYLVRLSASVAIGRRFVMVDGPYRFEVEALHCQPAPNNFWLVSCKILSITEGSLRQEWRMPVDQPARVQAIALSRSVAGRVKDISPFGMGIEISIILAPGTEVSIRTIDGFAYGVVRYCRPVGPDGFFIGILLRDYIQRPDRLPTRIGRLALRTLVQLARIAAHRTTPK